MAKKFEKNNLISKSRRYLAKLLKKYNETHIDYYSETQYERYHEYTVLNREVFNLLLDVIKAAETFNIFMDVENLGIELKTSQDKVAVNG